MLKTIFIYLTAAAAAGVVVPDIVEAQRFHSPRELLGSHFRSSDRVTFVQVAPTGSRRATVERRLARGLPKDSYTFYIATTDGRVDGYALFDDERGQHEMISFATFFDARGRVTDVRVMAYREPYGDGIRTARFRRQFVGRSADSGFRSGRDIDAVSGSTISSRSMARAVQRASVLLSELVLRSDGAALASR